MEQKTINQKEYLKKYMSFGDDNNKKKKKKKKHKVGAQTVKIIDDDIDLKNIRPIGEDEFDILLEGEDAPQIAGIIDERGPVDFSDKRRWKIITKNEDGDLAITSSVNAQDKNLEDKKHTSENKNDADFNSQSDNEESNLSPPRQLKSYDSDMSPPRKSRNYDSDSNAPRKTRNYDSDLSPPRQHGNYDSDLSPSRRNTKHQTSHHSSRNYTNSNNKDSDLDLSPPRKRKENFDRDVYESKSKSKRSRDSDSRTSRHKQHSTYRRSSPCSSNKADRRYKYADKSSSSSNRHDVYSSRRDKSDNKYEYLDRKSRLPSDKREKRRKSRWNEETDNFERGNSNLDMEHSKDTRDGRMTKTLDGKTAGLQDARALREETEEHRRREAEHFSKLSKTVSGVGQAAIVRSKTGRKRNVEAEAAEEREREIQQREIDEKYVKWGKGLKQTEDREEKLKNDLYEMNKPLARYADDADLDKELREQEREGDPMLEYIKEKQIKEGKRKADPPRYQGSYVPNRFGIKPGHRWDGVDRSNGYEKKWFEAKNAKVARQEEAYKWSTADM